MADILIGNVKGPQGDTGATGATGPQGDAATIEVGSVTTVSYGQTARVTNSGTSGAAIFDFVIPQGRPGEQTTDMQNLTLSSMTTSSASFPIPAIGETGKVIFGKIVKWFSDMSALVATKLNTSNVVNNLTTTTSGYALDARQGKTLDDKISGKANGAGFSMSFNETYSQFSIRVSGINYVRNGVTYTIVQAVFPIGGNVYYQGQRQGGSTWETIN